MPYEVNYTAEFGEWWGSLTVEQPEDIDARVQLLEEFGPALGRPTVDRIHQPAFQNMKELRCSSDGALRVLFAFDPRREAILLLGGNKAGNWDAWYDEAVPKADELYAQCLRELRREGVIE